MKRKFIVYLFILCCSSCMVEAGPTPYSYDEYGYAYSEYEGISSSAVLYHCYENYYLGECCEWIVEGYYEECIETWCYDEYWGSWELYEIKACSPI